MKIGTRIVSCRVHDLQRLLVIKLVNQMNVIHACHLERLQVRFPARIPEHFNSEFIKFESLAFKLAVQGNCFVVAELFPSSFLGRFVFAWSWSHLKLSRSDFKDSGLLGLKGLEENFYIPLLFSCWNFERGVEAWSGKSASNKIALIKHQYAKFLNKIA